jgi:hypothetical protein
LHELRRLARADIEAGPVDDDVLAFLVDRRLAEPVVTAPLSGLASACDANSGSTRRNPAPAQRKEAEDFKAMR